jgi:hypothetical protein
MYLKHNKSVIDYAKDFYKQLNEKQKNDAKNSKEANKKQTS